MQRAFPGLPVRVSGLILALAALVGTAAAHPEPDIPVRSRFLKDGTCTITVEIDPRCFTADPVIEPYTLNEDLALMKEPAKQALRQKAAELTRRWIEFVFEPSGKVEPAFQFDFTTLAGAPLAKNDDPVMITGTWKTTAPKGATGWRIHALKETPFAVIFRNFVEGVEQPRFSVLFPGETSFLLELTQAR